MELDETNSVTNRYVYGGHQQLIQEPTPGNDSNDQYLLHGGSVGNITHAMSRTQAVVNQYDYDAFGSRSIVAGGNSTIFGYTGEQYDSETGLLYLRARYYDPMLGRFITVVPYLGRMDEPVTQNRYIYVHNNPLGFVDPTGLAEWDFKLQAVAGVKGKFQIGPVKASAAFAPVTISKGVQYSDTFIFFDNNISGFSSEWSSTLGGSLSLGKDKFSLKASTKVEDTSEKEYGEILHKLMFDTPTYDVGHKLEGVDVYNPYKLTLSLGAGVGFHASVDYSEDVKIISNFHSEMEKGLGDFFQSCR